MPIVESKIEEVLRSSTPAECFVGRAVDPQRFILVAALTITEAGDEEALREISKLLKRDAKRFDDLVERTLLHAEDYRNPFTVA